MEVLKPGVDVSSDLEAVIAWRSDRLRDAGFPVELADIVARDGSRDLHALLELTDRGCPAELAARILAPLNEDYEPCR
jgi:hypothetical protein